MAVGYLAFTSVDPSLDFINFRHQVLVHFEPFEWLQLGIDAIFVRSSLLPHLLEVEDEILDLFFCSISQQLLQELFGLIPVALLELVSEYTHKLPLLVLHF